MFSGRDPLVADDYALHTAFLDSDPTAIRNHNT